MRSLRSKLRPLAQKRKVGRSSEERRFWRRMRRWTYKEAVSGGKMDVGGGRVNGWQRSSGWGGGMWRTNLEVYGGDMDLGE